VFDRLSERDKWTYLAVAALLVFGLAFGAARSLHPPGRVELHGIEVGQPTSPSSPNAAPPPQASAPTSSAPVAPQRRPAPVGPTEPVTVPPSDSPIATTPSQSNPNSSQAAPSNDNPAGLAWLNSASTDQLQELPGIGPSLAARIVEYREANGPFQAIDDLTNVTGIGPKRQEKIRTYLNQLPSQPTG
jgi:competence protein ComEA